MPKIFKKNQKIKVIEYGADQTGLEGLAFIRQNIGAALKRVITRA